MCSGHCKRVVASSALSSAFGFSTSPRQTDTHQRHGRSSTALIINNKRCTALAMQLLPAEQASGTWAGRCPPAPARPGPQPGQGRARRGCCQALPSFPSLFPSRLGCAGARPGTRCGVAGPPQRVLRLPYPFQAKCPPPLATAVPDPQTATRPSPRPRASPACAPQSLPHAGLAAPAPQHLLLPPGRPHLRGGRAVPALPLPLPSRGPGRLSGLRFCRHREGAAPPDPAATPAPMARAPHSPGAPAPPSRAPLSAEAGPGLLGILCPVPPPPPGLLSRRAPGWHCPRRAPCPQPAPEARCPLCQGGLSRRSELVFCSSEEGD